MQSTFEQVYAIVRAIPLGSVTTYGHIAKKLSLNPRVVGFALHANPYGSSMPCHRVVNRFGGLASGFAFGGPRAQAELLLNEHIEFKNKLCVKLEKHLFVP